MKKLIEAILSLFSSFTKGKFIGDNPKFYTAIKSLFPRLSQSQVDGLKTLLRATEGMQLSHRAYLLATAYIETAHTMLPIIEYGGVKYFDKYDTGRLAAALGNTPAKDGDGYKYRGRGYVQLTGLANYKRATKELKQDFVNKPDLALDPILAAKILITGCSDGWFTGKKLSDYLSPVKKDYVNARRVVNGTDKAKTIAGYAEVFEQALLVI